MYFVVEVGNGHEYIEEFETKEQLLAYHKKYGTKDCLFIIKGKKVEIKPKTVKVIKEWEVE